MYNQAFNELHTVRDFLRWSASQFERAGLFYGHGTDNAWDEAVALVSQVLWLPQGVDAIILDAKLTGNEKFRLGKALKARIDDRVPVPYITGKAWFCNMPFVVTPDVLIPRSPIAEMINNGFAPWLQVEPQRILDMCCGSACIGIAMAAAYPNAFVDCSDISPEALNVAAENVVMHDMAEQVQLVESDQWQAFDKTDVYDLIVVNPPYVDLHDYETMPPEFAHEPVMALTSGEDGLDFTKSFLAKAADHLSDEGLLVLEVGNSGLALEEQYPGMPITWVEFEHGGVGVLVMSKAEALIAKDLVLVDV